MEKINKLIVKPCNVVYHIPLCVNSYQEVIDAWKHYKKNRVLAVPPEQRDFIRTVFDFHLMDTDHIILYYSANQSECLLMCRINNKTINLSAPAYSIYDINKSLVATYS